MLLQLKIAVNFPVVAAGICTNIANELY